jgi:hypothetical protein
MTAESNLSVRNMPEIDAAAKTRRASGRFAVTRIGRVEEALTVE